MSRLLPVLVACAACGGGGTTTVDAPPGSADARADAHNGPCGTPPTTAPSTITVTGNALAIDGTTSTGAGVTVEVRKGGTTLASGSVNATTGAFSLSVATGGVPIDVTIRASASGYVDNDYYPPAPLAANFNVHGGLAVIRPAAFTALGTGQDTSHAFVVATTVDCANSQPLEGATITLAPAAASETYYDGSGNKSAAPTATTIAAMFTNAAPGTATVSASSAVNTFGDRSIDLAAQTLVDVELSPR
jgi:hypothetical protein